MRPPSGDQRGVVRNAPPKSVNCTAFEPSPSEIQISELPERLDIKVILLPSGENWGEESPRVEEMKGVTPLTGFGLFEFPGPWRLGAAMRQMF